MKIKGEMRDKLCAAVISVAAAAFAVLYYMGIASLDSADAAGMTVTRACASAALIALIVKFRYRVFAPRRGSLLCGIAESLPCAAVAVNNLPIIPLICGSAAVTDGADAVAMLALECLFIGIFEESAFRGIIFPVILERRRTDAKGIFISALLSSAIFGFIHLFNLLSGAGAGATLLQTGYSFLIGGMCAFVLLKTGSLPLCMLLHAVYDFCGYLIPRCGEGEIWNAASVTLTAAVGAFVFIYVVVSFYKIDPECAALLYAEGKNDHKIAESL